MILTLTGATGFIGKPLGELLRDHGHTLRVLGRRVAPPDGFKWDAIAEPPPPAAFEGTDAVIHLVGEPIAQRWTPTAWHRIEASRVDSTRRLVKVMAAMDPRPGVLICASATGVYGDRGDEVLTETSMPGSDPVARLCLDWERAARQAEQLGIRVVLLRTGLVLGRDGGTLGHMLPAFRLGLGGPLGNGRQWMSWIHLRDLIRLIAFALEQPDLSGPLNGAAPEPVTNRDFARLLGVQLRRPAVLPVPGFALRLLFGEMARILTASQRVVPDAALHHGFEFDEPTLAAALADILG
jgi:uncharacterized protein (TIGR01777 family)